MSDFMLEVEKTGHFCACTMDYSENAGYIAVLLGWMCVPRAHEASTKYRNLSRQKITCDITHFPLDSTAFFCFDHCNDVDLLPPH